MSLLVKAKRAGCDIVRVTPESAGWKHVGFSAHRLAPGESLRVDEAAREVCIVVLTGTASVATAQQTWNKIGGRKSVFDDTAPYAVYLPPGLGATAPNYTNIQCCGHGGATDRVPYSSCEQRGGSFK